MGYDLPAKYGKVSLKALFFMSNPSAVAHVIPMEFYGDRAKSILRTLYQKALQEASDLKATSIAFPAIGTGALCYPIDHSTSVAVEEVRKFLDNAPVTCTIQKIVFCVYGSPEQRTYKSLLPVFFPPLDSKKALESSAGGPTRPISEEEKHTLDAFETHAKNCPTCADIFKLYSDNQDLCADGYAAAQAILRQLYMNKAGDVFSTSFKDGKRVKVQIPAENAHCWKLLVVVEKSFRDSHRTRPFVSVNQPFATIFQDFEEGTPAEDSVGNPEVFETPNVDVASQAVLKRALKEANSAVKLENRGDTLGAMSAYTSAVQLLDRVIQRVTTQEDANKLQEIVSCPNARSLHRHPVDSSQRDRYAARIEQLRDRPVFAGIFARVGDVLKPFAKGEFTIDVYPGKAQVFDDALDLDKPAMILELDLNPDTALIKSKDADIAIRTRVNFQSPSHEPIGKDDVVFRCQDKTDCDRLFRKLKEARRPDADLPLPDPVQVPPKYEEGDRVNCLIEDSYGIMTKVKLAVRAARWDSDGGSWEYQTQEMPELWICEKELSPTTKREGILLHSFDVSAYSVSPDGGATPAPGEWKMADFLLQIEPGRLHIVTSQFWKGESHEPLSLELTSETYAKVSTSTDAQELRYIFVGRRYMPFHSLTMRCQDPSEAEKIAAMITQAAQRTETDSEEPIEERLEDTLNEDTERMILETQKASSRPLTDVPRKIQAEGKVSSHPAYKLAAFRASPDSGATPQQGGKWNVETAGYILGIKPRKLEIIRNLSPQDDEGGINVAQILVDLDLTPETYASIGTSIATEGDGSQDLTCIFVGRRYMPFHALTIRCDDPSQTEEVADAITKASQRSKTQEPIEETSEGAGDEDTERMVSEMQRASIEELEREREFVKKRARENAARRAREAESEEVKKEDARLREAQREVEELEERKQAERLEKAKSAADALLTSSESPQEGDLKGFTMKAQRLLHMIERNYPSETTDDQAASELAIEKAEIIALGDYLTDLELIEDLGYGWIPSSESLNRAGHTEGESQVDLFGSLKLPNL